MIGTVTAEERHDRAVRAIATTIAARQPLATVIEQARVVESLGYGALWLPEIIGRDAIALCAILGQHTETIGLATGIVPLPRRTPMQLAMAAATAVEATGGRFTLGVGIGHASTLGPGWSEPPTPSPLHEVERGLAVVRALLEGKDCAPDESIRLRGVHHGGSAPPIVLAALSPGLAGVAGRVADGLVLNWLTPERCASLAGAFRAAAEASGREPGRVFAYVPVCVTDDVDAAFGALARQVAAYGALPAYARSLARCGHDEGIGDVVAGGSIAPGTAARRALQALAAIGDREAVAARLDEFRACGVDVPLLAPVPVPGADAWGSMVRTWTELAPDASV
jgi:alkanesulfonate monooxygenase SsuD/methylene tetrahydromethanopterin reductase-like flavin-dependent oxidoreductase (luciferase family)